MDLRYAKGPVSCEPTEDPVDFRACNPMNSMNAVHIAVQKLSYTEQPGQL